VILENTKVVWPKLGDNAGTKYMSEDKEWSVDCLLSPEQAKTWKDSGVKPAVKDKDGQTFIKLKKDCVWRNSGDPKKPPMVVDKFGDSMDPLIIGNDSVCNVQYSIRDWEFQGQKGKSAELIAVQVLELNEYTGSSGDSVEFSFSAKEEKSLDAITEGDDDITF